MSLGRGATMRALELLSPVWTRFAERGCIRVLAYHDVPDQGTFRKQMAHLASRYRPIASSAVVGWLDGRELEDRACWVTFDDGDPSVVSTALPVLEAFEIPATIFVCPGVVDTAQPYWWHVVERAAQLGIPMHQQRIDSSTIAQMKRMPDDVRQATVDDIAESIEARTGTPFRRKQLTTSELRAWLDTGRDVGNHTWTHPILDTCSVEEQLRQIDLAHDWLTRTVGAVSMFAYPNGDTSDEARRRLEELGYRVALLFDHRTHTPVVNPMMMSRVRINADDPFPDYKAKVAGLHPWIHHQILSRV